MKKNKTIALTLIFLSVILWWYQPWSHVSPAGLNSTFHPDKRVENFRSMEKIYPYQTIKAPKAPYIWPGLDKAALKEPLNFTYHFKGETKKLSDFLKKTTTTGLLVLRDGIALHEMYNLGESPTSRHTSWSVAKSFTSTLIGMALDDGLITSLDDKVEIYLPSFKGTAYGTSSLKSLLQMSSGIAFTERYGKAEEILTTFSDVQKVMYKIYLLGSPLDDLLAAYPRQEQAGTRFTYRSSDTHILSRVVAKLYGKPFHKIVEEKIWQPLGMESDATWLLDGSENGVEIGFCCLNATLRDFAKLGELYRLGGLWQGKQLLSQNWITKATTPDAPHLMPGTVRENRGYGYQWWVPVDFDREYMAAGVWGQYIWVDEKAGVVITRTSVDPNFTAHMTETIAVMRAITNFISK